MKKRKIKAILFDVGGVLALNKNSAKKVHRGHTNLGIHEYIASRLNISLDQWFDSIDSVYAKSIEGKISLKKTLEMISKNVGFSQKKLKKIIIKAYKKNFRQNKLLFKKAFKLKKSGYKIAVLSDQWHFSKEALMPDKLYKKFNEIVVSCDVGMRKPNSKIYRLILKRLRVPVKQVLFIDNQEWNIKPAKKLGMKTILYKNNRQLFNDLKKLGI